MKRLPASALVLTALVLAAPLLAEAAADAGRHPRVASRPATFSVGPTPQAQPKAGTESYSVQVNVVTRIQGTSFFRTAIDITNNTTTDGVNAVVQYCYTFDGIFRSCTAGISIPLHNLDNFHTDDIVQYLGSQAVLLPGADQSSFGTLLVTFQNLPSKQGWEGTVTARTYSPYDQSNTSLGTVASAYQGSLFFESASGSLVGIVRDTIPAPTDAGALRTNVGVTNTALIDVNTPVQVNLEFWDVTPGSPTNGQRVGSILLPHALAAGEIFQVNNVFVAAAIPSNVDSCIVFADVVNPTGNDTIEGYVSLLDNGTRDNAYFEMKCAAGCGP